MAERSIYIIGSLRNPKISDVAKAIRAAGFDAFDDWYAAGPHADDCWRDYERQRGRRYVEALQGLASKHVFEFDRQHLERVDMGLLVLPAGKSGHLELGFLIGRGKPSFILLDQAQDHEEFRYDVMYRFATGVYETIDDVIAAMERVKGKL